MEWPLLLPLVMIVMAFWYAQTTFVPVKKAAELYNSDTVLLDVRSHAEYQKEHIPGSINCPLMVLGTALKDGKIEPGKVVFVYSASGFRSLLAQLYLSDLGNFPVQNLGSIGRVQELMGLVANRCHENRHGGESVN